MILICIIIVVYFIICMQKSFRNHISNVQSAKIFACGAQKNMDLHEQTLHERNFRFGEIHARGATEHISECERPSHVQHTA